MATPAWRRRRCARRRARRRGRWPAWRREGGGRGARRRERALPSARPALFVRWSIGETTPPSAPARTRCRRPGIGGAAVRFRRPAAAQRRHPAAGAAGRGAGGGAGGAPAGGVAGGPAARADRAGGGLRRGPAGGVVAEARGADPRGAGAGGEAAGRRGPRGSGAGGHAGRGRHRPVRRHLAAARQFLHRHQHHPVAPLVSEPHPLVPAGRAPRAAPGARLAGVAGQPRLHLLAAPGRALVRRPAVHRRRSRLLVRGRGDVLQGGPAPHAAQRRRHGPGGEGGRLLRALRFPSRTRSSRTASPPRATTTRISPTTSRRPTTCASSTRRWATRSSSRGRCAPSIFRPRSPSTAG